MNTPQRNERSTMIKDLYGICEAHLFDVQIGKIRKSVRYEKDMAREIGREREKERGCILSCFVLT